MNSRKKVTPTAAKRQLVFSKYHPKRPCSSCTLCGKQDGYYTHFESWAKEEKEFITQHLGNNLSPDSCICKAHKVEAKRYHSQEGYTPKWRGQVTSGKAVQQCIYPDCSATSTKEKLITPAFQSLENFEAALQIQSGPERPFILCSKHYHTLYKQFNSPQPCASCGLRPKTGTRFTRHSSDAITVTQVG